MSNQSICHAILLLLQHGYRPVGQLRFYLNSWQSNPNPPGMLFLLHFPRMMPMPVFQREVHSIFYWLIIDSITHAGDQVPVKIPS